ncbi:hypothetical protein LVY72_02540 [Arthrobacter sp. I2-34]|uniref:DUF5671 domain-containing protein n=1 Tax=Arthrobacter hankyongi TaxID=2904801 RepID=A0ABS9L267_9MICC|nr:hypothetical protein [Arthrobacter hankyongi]MCG2620787.1 hypothetical protein [Arthrobacter hankyongi]
MQEVIEEERPRRGRVLAVVSAIGPPITLSTALLIYFGWVRADAQARAMGLDVTLFGYTTQDLILFSLSHLFIPLVFALVAGLIWLTLDRWLLRRIHDPATRGTVHRYTLVAVVAGVLVAAVMLLLELSAAGDGPLFGPYVMAGGVLLAAWAVRLRRLARSVPEQRPPVEQRAAEAALVFGLVSLLMFWGAADHAQAVGQSLAASLEQRVATLPHAELYSVKPLGIGGPAVREVRLGSAASPLYRYDGLRLLEVSGGRFFFLHDGWTVRNGVVVVLPDDNSVRIEFGR